MKTQIRKRIARIKITELELESFEQVVIPEYWKDLYYPKNADKPARTYKHRC